VFGVETQPLPENRYRVVVTETFQPSPALESRRVQLYPAPGRIEHKQLFGVDRIEHRFDYAAQKPVDVIVTARSRIVDAAVAVPEIEVALPPR
jgi:hypothetical protein